jgi:hypothetical protein
MKSKITLILFLLCLTPMVSAMAGGNQPAPLAGGAPKLVIAALEHSFGNVKAGTPLKYSFKIKNEGDQPLEISNVAPSCGCTTSDYDKVIAPGKEGKITLEVAKTDSYKGEIVKNATVTTNDPNHQSFQLTLKANFTAAE